MRYTPFLAVLFLVVQMPEWSAQADAGDSPDGLISLEEDSIQKAVNRLATSSYPQITKNDLQRMQQTTFDELRNLKVALVVVDFQNDFISGSLKIQDGSAEEDPLEAIAPLNALTSDSALDLVVFTQDWHPYNHISFVESACNTDRSIKHNGSCKQLKPFDTVEFEDPPMEQVLYPRHCVQNSWGAELHKDVIIPDGATFIRKGTQVLVDSYSAFNDNNGHKLLELEKLLESNGITVVLGCGLAYDICLRHTLTDANELGYLTGVVRDCSKGLSSEGIEETTRQFACENIAVLDSEVVKRILRKKIMPIEWVKRIMERNMKNGTSESIE
uniref:nicotinamidase n=1 Tax=Haemonchus contortus TaxID=6289 RepID=A0A7I4YKE3_HAECO